MKKTIIVFAFILTFTFSYSQTNIYHPFPNSAIWRVDYYYDQPFQDDWCFYKDYFQYFTVGDTIINARVHKKINRSNMLFDSISCYTNLTPPGTPGPVYVGALRDDSIVNKTFFVLPNTTNDSLLYDYNLNVGDTMKGYIALFEYDVSHLVVLSIDSVLINGQYRKRWNFAPDANFTPDSTYFIEGIGSSCGLIEPLNTFAIDFTARYLVCVKDSLGTLFTSGYNSAYGCNLITVGIKEISNEDDLISIYPNPATSNITIQTPINSTVKILNLEGQIIKTFSAVAGNTYNDVSAIPSGIYFVEIKSEKGVKVKKLIKE
jgi:hypothetical protein